MTLYVVATPIGNLEDITLRAVRILREAPCVAAEDTRHSMALLQHLGIAGKRVVSLHAHSTDAQVERLATLLEEGQDIALLTDAGTPVVSDPGDALVRAAIVRGVTVVPIPGPSAVLTALVGSGLGGGAFRFVGFLPREGTSRSEALASVASATECVLVFESPNRVRATLEDLAAIAPTRPACVARELTKMHEEFTRGTLAELAALEREWLGEVTLVLGAQDRPGASVTDDALDERIDAELAKGGHAKGVAERLAAWSGRARRDVYERVVARKQKGRS
ncbi:MAG: 16S rRNA (cytidine(1402)-2'-O)-methyltransferase [Myxococcales bacterium]|nr:16S rRNA (cytidine(1402)-2'-O)-methyltransferase [Myxococcales bacterium]